MIREMPCHFSSQFHEDTSIMCQQASQNKWFPKRRAMSASYFHNNNVIKKNLSQKNVPRQQASQNNNSQNAMTCQQYVYVRMNHQRDFVLKICATSASNPEMNYSRVVHHASFRQINQVLLRHLLLLMAEARELRRSCHASCKNWKPVTSLQWMGRWRRLCIHVIVFFLVPSSKNRSFRPPLMAIPRSKSKPRIAISVLKWLKIVLRCSKLWANILKTVRKGKKTPRNS